MGQTISEKIFSSHSGMSVKAGELVVAKVDFCFCQDGTAPLTIRSFEEIGFDRVFDPERACFVLDHNSPSPVESVSLLHDMMRNFSKKHGIRLFDIGEGVCHQVIPEAGYVNCGNLIVGADSHTCTYGALNAFSTGVGSTDLAVVLGCGALWFRVPDTIKVELVGELPPGVLAKDLILYIIKDIGTNGATYCAMEFVGSGAEALSVEGRLTVSNMVVEMGAKAGIFCADQKTERWLRRRFGDREITPVFSDDEAKYKSVKTYDLSHVRPMVSFPHQVSDAHCVDEIGEIKINQAFLGTCTNGRAEDLEIASRILKGKKVRKGVRLIIAPASRSVLLEAMDAGYIQTLLEAGGVLVSPGCGCCVGTHCGVPAPGERVLSTANRNFKGRMGSSGAEIYLCSPATLAASCIEGRIADPRNFL